MTSPQPLLRLYSVGRFRVAADIGTARSQWADEAKNPTGGEDVCLGNVIKNNYIMTNVRRDCRPCVLLGHNKWYPE